MKSIDGIQLIDLLKTARDEEREAEIAVAKEALHGLLRRRRACLAEVEKAKQALDRAQKGLAKIEERLAQIEHGNWSAIGEVESVES